MSGVLRKPEEGRMSNEEGALESTFSSFAIRNSNFCIRFRPSTGRVRVGAAR
jgi:hypothetical protein